MKLLVIDDNQKLLTNLRKIIAAEKHLVHTASTGRAGLDKALNENYDVIILDLYLPDIDGLDVCRQLRGKGLRTPVIMLTARDTVDDRVRGLDSGADDYLVKPFGTQELLARIRSLVRRNEKWRQTDDSLRAGDLELNLTNHEVSRGGTAIALSLKEYNLLEVLLRKAGRVVTHDQLLAHLWEKADQATPEQLAVLVRYLRRKLDDPFETKLLQTVKGFGYKIHASTVH